MAGQTGINSLEDLRKQQQAGSAAEIGYERINEILQAELDYLNRQVSDALAGLSSDTTDKMRVYGTNGSLLPLEVDEFGRAPTKKEYRRGQVAFPLRLYKTAVGWTTKFLESASAAEIAERYIMVRTGHTWGIQRNLARALFLNTNETDYDVLDEGREVELIIRRLVNADGQPIPNSPAGVVFDPNTHTHYIARVGSLAATDIDAVIATVTEHGHTRGLKLYINSADAAAIRALTAGFIALSDSGIVYNATDATRISADFSDLEDQLIGFWRHTGIEIWVKPWVPANYVLAFASDTAESVLARRVPLLETQRGLRLMPAIPSYPLVADNFESMYGFGAWNRTAAAVLYIGATTWANPVLPTLNALESTPPSP